MACAAANAVLDVLSAEELPDRALDIGRQVMARFRTLAAEHPCITGVHGLGAMCALVIGDPTTGAPDPERAARLCGSALDRGLLLMTASGNIIGTLMPLVISDLELRRALDILSAAVGALT